MKRCEKFTEFDFLDLFYQKMIEKNQTYKVTSLTVNHRMVEDIYDRYSISLTLDELKKLASKCKANGWLTHPNTGMYHFNLSLTGLGVVKSKALQKESAEKQELSKKISHFIDERKGIFLLFGFVITFAMFLMRYWSMKNGN